jgi:O-succinylbenzoic acid--CoA ligase
MHAILAGGAPLSAALEQRVRAIRAPVYHTYGMTETATHVALRRLNGKEASESFSPLPGVAIDVDERGCLRVKGPMTLNRWLQTNDRVELLTSTPPAFRWLGRWDNVVNTGGVKVQVEAVEEALEQARAALGLGERRYFIAGLPDQRLGQAVTLVIEGEPLPRHTEEDLLDALRQRLEPHHSPRRVVYRASFAETATGKIDRQRSLDEDGGEILR